MTEKYSTLLFTFCVGVMQFLKVMRSLTLRHWMPRFLKSWSMKFMIGSVILKEVAFCFHVSF